MRNITLLFLLIATSVCTFAQDIIVLKDSTFIKAKVLEVGLNKIKYKKFNYTEGPFYLINKDEVSKIQFENGTSETMLISSSELSKSENTLNSVGFGFGKEFGEIGIRVQRRFSDNSNFAFRVGVGSWDYLYFPVGLKYYIENVYFDLGASVYVSDYYGYKLSQLYSLSFSLGTDINLSKRFACNASAGLALYNGKYTYYDDPTICWSFGFFYKL